MFFKALVIIILLVIVSSLASALHYLLNNRDRSARTVKALTVRISLSIGLFLLLLIAALLGWIKPHGVRPPPSTNPHNTQLSP